MSYQALLKEIGDGEDFENDVVHVLYRDIVNHSPNALDRAYAEMRNMQLSKENISQEFITAETPFPLIVALGDLELVQIMINHGVDVNRPDAQDQFALNTACLRGDLEMAKFLLQNGADINGYDGSGRTPLSALFQAVNEQRTEFISVDDCYQMTQLLVSYGAKLNKSSNYIMRAFYDAVKYANLDTVRLLVNEANGDLNCRPYHEYSCLHAAVLSDEPGVLEYVIGVYEREKMDIDVHNYWGQTPLMWASEPNVQNHKAIKMLLKLGADFRIRDDNGRTSFDMLITGERDPELAWLYFDAGYDVLDCEVPLLYEAARSGSSWLEDIIAEIAKKEMMGARIVGKNQEVFNLIEQLRSFLRRCKQQLRKMQKMHFYKNVSFWNVLTGDQSRIVKYAQNSELVKAFFITKCNESFPIYCARIRHKLFENVPRNHLIDICSHVVCETIKRPTMYEILQHEVMIYLEDKDFLKILDCCRYA